MLRRSLHFASAALALGALITAPPAFSQPAAPAAPAAAAAAPATAAPAQPGALPPGGFGQRGGRPMGPATATTVALAANLGRQQEFLDIAKQGDIDLVFLGDSITDFWRNRGLSVWNKVWAPLKTADLAVSGERIEQVLWRVQNGILDGYKAKALVMMIGTNNLARSSNQAIVEGIKVLVPEITKRQPDAKLLLLGIFPRGEAATDPNRQRIKDINTELAKLDDGKKVFYMDIGDKFLAPDGTLTKEIMPDALHPDGKGYQIWADAMLPKVKELMGAK